MKKQISKILIAIFLMQTFASPFFTHVSAQEDTTTCEKNPPVCTATSPNMTKYLEFQKEMAALLSTNKFKTATETVAEGKGGLFTSKILTLSGTEKFSESLAGQTLRIFDITATRSATSILTSLFLFELAAIGALADNTIGLTILLQDRPIVRDWSKLLDVEWTLSQIAYALGSNGDIGRTITEVEAFNTIIKKYEGEGLLLNGKTNFGGSIAYTDIIMQLAELNSAVKWFLAYDSTGMLESYNEIHNIKIDSKWYTELESEYKCARRTFGFKCSNSWAALVKNLKILTNNTATQGKGAVKQIKQSYSDLKGALGNWTAIKDRFQGKDLTLTDREIAILEGRYGLNAAKMTKGESSSLIALNSNIGSKWDSLAKGVKTATKSFKGAITDFKEKWKNKDSEHEALKKAAKEKKENMKNDTFVGDRLTVFIGRNTETGKESEFVGTKLFEILSGYNAAIKKSRMDIKAIVNTSNNLDLSKNYIVLLTKIKNLVAVIGNKEQGLRSTLNTFCSAQCANKGNDCCYVK